MTKTTLLVIVLCLYAGTVVYSQSLILQQKMPSKYNGAELFVALEDIHRYTKLTVFTRSEWMKCTGPVYCHEDSLTVGKLLQRLFYGQPLNYQIKKGTLEVSPKPLRVIVTGLFDAPLSWVSVTIPGRKSVMTNNNGEVIIDSAACEQVVHFSRVGYESYSYVLHGDTVVRASMKINRIVLDSVSKFINTGFQLLYKGQFTGSYDQIPKAQLERLIATSILTKMEARAPGLLLNKNRMPGTNLPFISIRGQSTIAANTEPLYVVDNLPYYGNIENINPNDIESITVLKDAAATSIWGARAGNGVVVLTTKKGNYQRKPSLELNTALTITARPDFTYLPLPGSKEYIEINGQLFANKYFDEWLKSDYLLVPPDVLIRQQYRVGTISEKEMEAQLDKLRAKDVRNDQRRWLYQTGSTTTNTLSITGGSDDWKYYAGGGFENEAMAQVHSYRRRATVTGNLNYHKEHYEFGVQVFFTDTRSRVHATPDGLFPYSELVNAAGEPNEVSRDLSDQYKNKKGVVDVVQDWSYRPLQENRENTLVKNGRHARITITGKLQLIRHLNLQLIYERQQGKDELNDLKGTASYYARNLQNRFAVNNGGIAEYLIPLGGVLDREVNEYIANKARLQLNYEWNKNRNFRLSALGGIEYGKFRTDSAAMRYFGYFDNLSRATPSTSLNKNYALFYDNNFTDVVPNFNYIGSGFDFYPSAFANAAITVWRRYTLSVSGRIDQSNLFGAKTNNQTIPLWSSGFKWNAGDESFYPMKSFLPYCTIRTSYGYSGNVDKRTTAYASAVIAPPNRYNAIPMEIISPDNPYLRWERSGFFNVGIELADSKRQLQWGFEYYRRKSSYLLAPGAQDPTLGSSFFWGNNAVMKGSGFDLSIETNHTIDRKWQLNNWLLLSRTINKVTRYDNSYKQAWYYTDPGYLSPKTGASVYSLYAYRWGGLDTAGDPRSYLNGQLSKRYDSIATASPDSMMRIGSSVPTLFGSFYTAVGFAQFTLAATIVYKGGYYIRRSSVNYNEPLNVVAAGLNDYASRWQQAGDEATTNVPSLKTDIPFRDMIYNNAELLVIKGDQVRLHDVSLTYSMPPAVLKKWKLQAMSFYVIGNNLGFLYKAAPGKIDPDYLTGNPQPKSVTVGVKCTF